MDASPKTYQRITEDGQVGHRVGALGSVFRGVAMNGFPCGDSGSSRTPGGGGWAQRDGIFAESNRCRCSRWRKIIGFIWWKKSCTYGGLSRGRGRNFHDGSAEGCSARRRTSVEYGVLLLYA